ncbi:MAG: zf-HC2 domain-containing protein [Acidobacteria bacterium]|nr:zf-HC2 domain-containing protein [Candidatus Sulfomarinibacter sp. MAG AM2]
MTDRKNDPDRLIDLATAEIRNDRLDEISERQATDRVWNKLSTELEIHRPLTGCDDFQSEIPAYVAGSLPEARALLVGDHTRECVPCRRVLMAVRSGKTPTVRKSQRDVPSLFGSTFLRVAAAVFLVSKDKAERAVRMDKFSRLAFPVAFAALILFVFTRGGP